MWRRHHSWTGLFHLRQKESSEVEFHQSRKNWRSAKRSSSATMLSQQWKKAKKPASHMQKLGSASLRKRYQSWVCCAKTGSMNWATTAYCTSSAAASWTLFLAT